MARDSYGRHCRPGVLAVSPPDDDGGDYIQHLIDDGGDLLKRKPRDICSVLSNAHPQFDDVIADLLRALWIDPIKQNVRLRKLAEWLRDEPEMVDIAQEVIDQIADENHPDYSED